jgi:pimeloyl-ACP methyl ester carboxylesterase
MAAAKNKQAPSKSKQPAGNKHVWLPIVLVAVLVLALAIAALWYYRVSAQKECVDTSTAVRLAEGADQTYNVAGELCYKGNLGDKTVQLLISGHTYDSTYWDFPYESETYSYVDAAIDAGYATFNIDRPGVGKSDVPDDPSLLTTPSQGFVVHQLVEALRAGRTADTNVDKVVLVGHSLGTGIALYTAGAYGNVDAVVGTGGLSDTNPNFIPQLQSYFHSANQDPKFSDQNLPDGYVTTQPGMRGESFYNTSYAEQAVIDEDERSKQPGTPQAIITLPEARAPQIAEGLRIPLFFPVGEKDALYCDLGNPSLLCDNAQAIVEREKEYFPNACIEAYIQPNAGHDGNLHPNAPDMFGAVNAWLDEWVGKTAEDSPVYSC